MTHFILQHVQTDIYGVFRLSYLQQQTVVNLREDGRVVVDVDDSDGDEDS